METCDALFLIEGATAVPLVRCCLVKVYEGKDDGLLKLQSPSQSQSDVTKSKLRVANALVGLFNFGGKDEGYKTLATILRLSRQGMYQKLRHLILVRDLDDETPEALHENLIGRMDNLARKEGAEFSGSQTTPVLGQFDNVTISQVLLGDPTFGSHEQHTVEDHIIQFLHQQESRDPSELAKVVEGHLGRVLGLKQRVQLAMVIDDYSSAPRGFYERVVEHTSNESLEVLAGTIGIAQVIEAIDA